MQDKYHIRVKHREQDSIINIYNNVFNQKNGVAFFQIDREWELLFARKCIDLKTEEGDTVYEGDILGYKDKLWEVIDEGWRIVLDRSLTRFGENNTITVDEDVIFESVLAGNIYDTKNLLKHAE